MRLTKDRIWNLITFACMCLTVFAAEQTESALVLMIAFTLVPYLLSLFNRVQYSTGGVFTNSLGEDLSDRLPKKLGLVLLLTILLTACLGVDVCELMPEGFSFVGVFLIIWSIPLIYFIFINCPISIMSNRYAYQAGVTGIEHSNTNVSLTKAAESYYINSPSYRNMPGNKYYNSLNHQQNRH